jgi:GntR family transcriptional regulator
MATLRSRHIDPASPSPKYRQLREILLDLIAAELDFDAPIPSERDLAKRFGLSRMTARQAVDELVAEGRLYRVTAKGTFVARPSIVVPLRMTSFTQDMHSRGLRAGARALAARTTGATQQVAEALRLSPGDPVHVIERLRTADDVPMAIERAHLPAALTPGLLEQPLADRSLYTVIEERYGVVLDHGEQTIEASLADEVDAQLLQVMPGSAVLRFTRWSSAVGIPIEYVVSTYRADRYQLRVALEHPNSAPSASIPSGERP